MSQMIFSCGSFYIAVNNLQLQDYNQNFTYI
jgi:hypothetical protein